MQDTIDLIRQWFHDKGIIANSNPLKQLGKTQEELTELRDEIVILNTMRDNDDPSGIHLQRLNAKLEMGDVFVTLFGVCEMLQFDPAECMDLAYLKISKRQGEMKDGMFVKNK